MEEREFHIGLVFSLIEIVTCSWTNGIRNVHVKIGFTVKGIAENKSLYLI